MTADVECRCFGRDFTAKEIALLRALIAANPPPNRHALSREFCRRTGWFKPDGGLKDMMAGMIMLAMHRDGRPLAVLGFSTAACKLTPRDRFIGWTPQLREKNLSLVIDNPKFLILSWIQVPNLGSHILALVRRRLPGDWTERCHVTPVLIETFVETPRFTGALYKMSGWTRVGTTRGRGRYDRHTKRDQAKKHVWLRPLRRDRRRKLNR